ncbi:MAG: hypothetical protein GWN62_13845 [Aliifodinibius sp.]|nr:hypothetical protein [Fodinibius sp.]
MKEYLILRDTDEKLTKKLNQWRHYYHLEIVSVLMDNRVYIPEVDVGEPTFPHPWGTLVILLTREEKEDWEGSLNEG